MVEMIRRTTLLAVLLLGATMTPADAEPAVDIALVLAVDVSLSIDAEEFALQRAGYAAAWDAAKLAALARSLMSCQPMICCCSVAPDHWI